jgi:pilus assembly protein FimV
MSLKLRAAISALLLAPQAAFALGLGDIRLNSALNEPLSAEIELVAPTNDELNALSAQLASRELFQRYGLDRPGFLDSMQFTVGRGRDGRNVLLVNSASPISEPFVTFLVEVNWPRGRLLREYTVLLDPPVFAPQETVPPAPVAAPRAAQPATAPARAPAATPAAPRPAAATQRPVAAPPSGDGSSYRVQPGDTLYGVASRYAGGDRAETNRMMIAMFRANPEAFGGNINVLRSGAILRVPGPEALSEVSAGAAASEIGRQNASWRGGEVEQEPARLRLVTPTEAAPESTAGEPVATDPSERISQLNREIEESQRLLELKNAELARLQQQVADQAAAAQAAAEAEAAPEAAGETPVEEAPAAEVAPVTPPPVAEPRPEPAPAQPSFVDRLTENWQYLLGAAALLLGGGLAWGYLRRRREDEVDEAIRRFEPPPSAPVPSETQRLRALSPEAAGSAAGATLGTATEDQEFEEFHTATMPPSGRRAEDFGASFEDTLSAEEPSELDQGDPLAEADFHMAYGLYDQAADIVKLALDKGPSRRDLKMKLLEIFFVSGDKAHFLEAAREYAAGQGDGEVTDWDRVLIMGRQLAPDDPLFESGAGSAGVDLNLEGGDSRVDLELLAPPEGDDGLDLDLGEVLEASDAEADTGQNELLDFDLGVSADAATRELPEFEERTSEMPAGDSPTVESTRLQPVSPESTAEMPALDESTIASTRLQPVSPDSTAEVAVDDLGIDLGDLDALSEVAPEDDVTRIVPLDEETLQAAAADEAMDFDLSDLSPEVTAAGSTEETQQVDLDVGGSMSEAEASESVTEQVSLDELPEMSELEPVTMSEVGTKLDLARAYVDMGDPEGARSILEEVLKEGSASQKQEAQRLLDSLPGA